MPTSTTNYGLIKPGTDDPILIGQLNDNADVIDAALKENADAIENKPDAADIPPPSTAAPAMDGTAAAGTSTDYARADHIHPSDTSKASATSEAEDRAALVELVDSGAKNFLKLGFSKKISGSQTAEMTADGNGVIVNGSRNTTTDSILVFDIVTNLSNSLDTRYTLPAGEYIMTKTGNVNVRLQVYAHDGTDLITLGYTQASDLHFEYTNEMKLQYPYLVFRVWAARVSNFDNFTFYPMICTKAAWDISHAYQPYRPSYQELYERVVALEQANGITRSIQAAPTSTDNEEDMR